MREEEPDGATPVGQTGLVGIAPVLRLLMSLYQAHPSCSSGIPGISLLGMRVSAACSSRVICVLFALLCVNWFL